MQNAFACSVSSNVLKVDFLQDWDHVRYYQTLFNATGAIVREMMATDNWALVINWGDVLVQIPEEEPICVRTLSRQIDIGLSTVINIINPHPIAEWQLKKIVDLYPQLTAHICNAESDAFAILEQYNFDTQVMPVEYRKDWKNASEEFSSALENLSLSKEMFLHSDE
jgi:hypothetical protein